MIFRRHTSRCPVRRAGRRSFQCRCPVWLDTRINGKRVLASLHTTNWQDGQVAAENREQNGEQPQPPQTVEQVEKPSEVTIEEALKLFLARVKDRGLRPSSVAKYELLSGQMQRFTESRKIHLLCDLTLDLLEQFQGQWKAGPLAKGKRLERVRQFFRWAHARGWLDENPAAGLEAPIIRTRPTLPFTSEEVEKILEATKIYPDQTGKVGRENSVRLSAFILLLRFSGVRIGDAVSLRTDKLDGQKLFRYTQKTGCPVYCVLPEFVAEALPTVPRLSSRHFFWTGNSTLHTAIGRWQRSLRNLFKLAGVSGHPHMLRDTFATELLLAGFL
jgi:site-specific recombinase XerD